MTALQLTLTTDIDVKRDPTDPEGFILSLSGVLKTLANVEPGDLREDAREVTRNRIRRYQARVCALLATDTREPGIVLVEAFGGDALRADFARRGVDAVIDALDRAERPALRVVK